MSVTVMMVLLNELRTWTFPLATPFFPLEILGFASPVAGAAAGVAAAAGGVVAPSAADPSVFGGRVSVISFYFLLHCFNGFFTRNRDRTALTSARVRVGPLTVYRQALAMTRAAIAAHVD